MVKICPAVARQQQLDQRVEKALPAAPPQSRSELIFGPRPVPWSHQNPKAEIPKPSRHGRVLWHR
jgi:hypothetical protein